MPGHDGTPALMKKSAAGNQPGKSFDSWLQQVNECNRAVDEGVGRIISALEESGLASNTLVIYSADQGFAVGEHGLNQKVAPYDAAISSPLIIRWDGKAAAGQVCSHAVNSPDLVDLICRAADVTLPWKTHGRDIRPLLTNPAHTSWNTPMLLTNTGRHYGQETDVIPTDDRLTAASKVPWYAMLRQGTMKYIRNFVEGETEELYDLRNDPDELENLASRTEHSNLMNSLRKTAIEELKRTDAGFVNNLPKTKSELESKP